MVAPRSILMEWGHNDEVSNTFGLEQAYPLGQALLDDVLGPVVGGRHAERPRCEQGGQLAVIGGTSLRSLVAGLNRIGLKPPGIIAILQAIKTAAALQADLVVQ